MSIDQGEKLRKVSDSIYQEANPPADRSRPLEWRQDFNSITLPLKILKVVTTCSVNEVDWSVDDDSLTSPWGKIKPSVKVTRSVRAVVDEEVMQDRIYRLAKAEEDKDIFVVKPSGEIQVILREGEPVKNHKTFPDGIFPGHIFHVNYEPGDDYICLDVIVPSDQLQAVLTALTRDRNVALELSALVLSFSYEVDDALRESYHSRDLLIGESISAAPIETITFASVVGDAPHAEESAEEEAHKDDGVDYTEAVKSKEKLTATALVDLSSLSRAVSRISTAIWVALVCALLIFLLK